MSGSASAHPLATPTHPPRQMGDGRADLAVSVLLESAGSAEEQRLEHGPAERAPAW